MSIKLRSLKQKPLLALYGLGLVLLVAAGWLWCNRVSTNPERVFWGMIGQSMKTTGVTVGATQASGTSTYKQTVQYSFGGQDYVHSLVSISQPGTTVQDEMIGTPKADYTRYTSIKTDQKNSAGKALDTSKVLGVWAKTDNGSSGSQLLSQSILGLGLPFGGVAVPIADLSPKLYDQLLTQIKNDKLYQVSFDKVKKTHENGRLIYTYEVSCKAEQYVSMLKSFAKSVGLDALNDIEPNNYAGQPALDMILSVDVRALHLTKAEIKNAGVKQTYTSYDVPVSVKLPTKTITSLELQTRLQQMQ